MPLSDRKIKALKPSSKPAKYSDGGGLHLLVTPQGNKLWRQAYRFGGKQKTLALGSYPSPNAETTDREQALDAYRAELKGLSPDELVKRVQDVRLAESS